MRVTSDRQTLILAGETPPRRAGSGLERLASDLDASDAAAADSPYGGQRMSIISARVDAVAYDSLPALPPTLHQAYVVSNRGSSSHAGANAYARTRDLSDRTPPLIDTYA